MAYRVDEVLSEGIRTLFILGVPVVLVVSLAGTLSSVIQTVTSIQDPSISYAVRLIALVSLIYFFAPMIQQHIIILAEMAFKS